MSESTPAPWVVREYATSTFIYPAGIDGPPIALVSLPGDAAFIAHAVNCHADLFAACEAVCDALAWDSALERFTPDGDTDLIAEVRLLCEAVLKARGLL